MKTRHHFIVSGLVALALIRLEQYVPAILAICSGWLMDVDHEVDHYYRFGKFAYNPTTIFYDLGKKFLLYPIEDGKAYMPLHSLELLFIGVLFKVNSGILLSFGLHLLMDMFGNRVKIQDMSVLWRIKNKWKIGRF